MAAGFVGPRAVGFRTTPYRGPIMGRAAGTSGCAIAHLPVASPGYFLRGLSGLDVNLRARVKWGVWSMGRMPVIVYRLFRCSLVFFRGCKELGFSIAQVPVASTVPVMVSVPPMGSRCGSGTWGGVTVGACTP